MLKNIKDVYVWWNQVFYVMPVLKGGKLRYRTDYHMLNLVDLFKSPGLEGPLMGTSLSIPSITNYEFQHKLSELAILKNTIPRCKL